jgi:hypothetical protein
MTKLKWIFALLLCVLTLAPIPSFGALSPLSVNIVPPVQFPPSDFSVTGARVSALYGKHRDMYGIDIGVLGNITEQRFVGAAVSGLFNMTHGNTTVLGLQLAAIANINTQKTNVYGVQAALMSNWNEAESSVTGLQFSVANVSPNTSIYGLQAGLYNKARSVYGFQIGLVNIANDLHGIQIGLVNFNHTGTFSVSPILNVGF